MFPPHLLQLASSLLEQALAKGIMVATAESCTGGLVAGVLTEIAGSSAMVDRGFVTYSNAAKTAMLGVPTALIDTKGAVSEEVAIAMAQGALTHSNAQLSVAITGIAGPGGGSAEKPVGLVHFATASKGSIQHQRHIFPGNRQEIRLKAVEMALKMLVEAIAKH